MTETDYKIVCDHQDKSFASFNAQIVGGEHIGFINASNLAGIGVSEIMVLTVDSEFRKKGVGRSLLRQAESWAAQQDQKYIFMVFAPCDLLPTDTFSLARLLLKNNYWPIGIGFLKRLHSE